MQIKKKKKKRKKARKKERKKERKETQYSTWESTQRSSLFIYIRSKAIIHTRRRSVGAGILLNEECTPRGDLNHLHRTVLPGLCFPLANYLVLFLTPPDPGPSSVFAQAFVGKGRFQSRVLEQYQDLL